MDVLDTFQRLGTAAALGLLVGLQREHAGASLAGIRTFTLFCVFGTLCGLLAATHGGWLLAAGLLAVSALLVGGNLRQPAEGSETPGTGLTTEVAALVMFALGAFIATGPLVVPVVVAGALAVLLHLKPQMHALVRRLEPKDLTAAMQFVLISLVILPLLPDQAYGPYQVLNPRNVWWMVVLIVGVQLAGWLLVRVVGQQAGALLGGVLGGLVSSTATTVAYARQARNTPGSAPLAATVIVLASTVALVRVMVVAALVAPQAVVVLGLPLGVLLLTLIVLAGVQALTTGRATVQLPTTGNPAELKPALIFAGLYALVTLAIAAAQDWLGHSGLYLVALVSGLTDMDAVTLSSTRLLAQDRLVADVAWRVIVIAALANLVFKGVSAWVLGGRELGRRVLLLFAIAIGVGVGLLVLWPAGEANAAASPAAPLQQAP